MRIARVANFVSPTSGGIRTALRHWGECYQERGYTAGLVIPGPGDWHSRETQGDVYRLPAWEWPDKGGYSIMLKRQNVIKALTEFEPDRVEVSDRTSLRWVGGWARQHGIPSVMISHENVTGILRRRVHAPESWAERGANFANIRTARAYDVIVCPSAFAAEEFHRMGIPARVVPLGVDLADFRPPNEEDAALVPDGSEPKLPGRLYLVHCGRLHREKNPKLSIETLRQLVTSGTDAHLTMLGTGPMREQLERQAVGLPVTFMDYVSERTEVAKVLGRADIGLAPGTVETFGLAALEALACGAPVVCPDEGALQEVVGQAGRATRSTPAAFVREIKDLLTIPDRRQQARAQAERFSWELSAEKMLAVHEAIGREPLD